MDKKDAREIFIIFILGFIISIVITYLFIFALENMSMQGTQRSNFELSEILFLLVTLVITLKLKG